ncbi:hypothetical protein A2397_03760 [Candidatus Amesbacteria bacterium RIFOXYB1_FULL_44_23]|uniref:Glycosyltransferase RgtA/B/C/D-like domain-containing protein n=1 Tax=Candidatus Amesbacteria bacterium RIFOXYB1_FULL_44_23 TaxID=1797263 RepID=A0A1F4ZPC9_9BACT|nr:MAG: hypothetical protein A2397_03760 [Candidatus Amesbacteria bacterium RIFOXYB1_FULL_44_23]
MKALAKLAVGIWLMTLGYFGYLGATTLPSEGDSLAYHLPIAKLVETGEWTKRENFYDAMMYYPSYGETVVAGFIKMGIPANLFNVLGWVVFSGVAFGLGRRLGLGRDQAVIAAVTVAMWPTVVRLLNNQTIDIWVGIWWMAALRQLLMLGKSEKPKNAAGIKNWVWLGIYLGLLVGTKYSGVFYAVILAGVYGSTLWRTSTRQKMGFGLAFLLIGGFWYVRNWLVIGNPVYPAQVLGFVGVSELAYFSWRPWMTVIRYPGLLVSALVSEYLVWSLGLLAPLIIRNKLILLGLLNLTVFLILPSSYVNVVSDMRYNLVVFLPIFFSGWRWMAQRGRGEVMAILGGLSIVSEMTQMDFRPKMFVGLMVVVGVCLLLINRMNFKPLATLKIND